MIDPAPRFPGSRLDPPCPYCHNQWRWPHSGRSILYPPGKRRCCAIAHLRRRLLAAGMVRTSSRILIDAGIAERFWTGYSVKSNTNPKPQFWAPHRAVATLAALRAEKADGARIRATLRLIAAAA